jgi:DNA-binding MarR family transcriptional regulator
MITPTPRRKVDPNSVKVYHEEIKGEKENSQDQIIVTAVKKFCNAVSMRQIQKVTGLEINVVSRAVNSCKKKKLIEKCFDAECVITGRRVSHYTIYSEKICKGNVNM